MPQHTCGMPQDEPHKVLSIAAVVVVVIAAWSVYCVRTFTQIFTVAKPVAATWPTKATR